MGNQVKKSFGGMNILFIAAEADPLVKKGGLGDVAGSLPVALKNARPNLDIRLAIPHYQEIKLQSPATLVKRYSLPSADGPVQVNVSQTEVNGLIVYLVGGGPIHADLPVYVNNPDILGERFFFFSLACVHLGEELGWPIDILHANDWHTAVALHALKSLRGTDDKFNRIRSLLTVHNLPFMGAGSESGMRKFLIPPAQNQKMPPWARTLPLPMGINAADRVVAVSPGYAKEIITPDFGCDLQDFLVSIKDRIGGIVNGIDYASWNPQKDTFLFENYSSESLASRAINKKVVGLEFSFPKGPDVPLLAFIGRLDRQKGIDVIIDTMRELVNFDWQLVVLAKGDDTDLSRKLNEFKAQYPNKVGFREEMNLALSRCVYAGADMLLMPSKYEPCGLAQLIAMHYGCVPIASATGGLKDTIHDYSANASSATGFLSPHAIAADFAVQVKLALTVFTQKEVWTRVQKNGMASDFSWQKPAKEYLALYDSLLK
jgi:starch synthase